MSELPDSFGDVTGEYLAARNEVGLVAGHHELVTVRGPDVVPFLQGIVSQDLAAAQPGDVTRSFLLGPEGKLRALLWVLKGDDEVLLAADAGRGAMVATELTRYRFRVDVEIEAAPRPLLELWGPQAERTLASTGLPVPAGWQQSGSIEVAAAPLGGLVRFLVIGADREQLVAAGARPVGYLAATALRVEAGEPQMGRDVDEKTIPQETGLVAAAVSFTKGCYVGQELVARIDSRGRVNRLLRGVVIHENVLPPEGAELIDDDREVGTVTSVAESLTLRAPVALSLVRREVEPGNSVTVRWDGGSVSATLREVPLSDFTES